MTDISTIRHQSIFDPSKVKVPIHIIGAGATGSRVWLALVELGLTDIAIYDYDHVEAHNLANQVYLHRDIGTLKVNALAAYYRDKTGKPPPHEMRFIDQRVEAETSFTDSMPGIVMLLTDTMASRAEIYDAVMNSYNSRTIGFIETRMASSYGNIFTVNNRNDGLRSHWHRNLPDDERTEQTVCGASISVGPTAAVIANMAVWQLINLLTDRNAVDYSISLFLKPLIVNVENPNV